MWRELHSLRESRSNGPLKTHTSRPLTPFEARYPPEPPRLVRVERGIAALVHSTCTLQLPLILGVEGLMDRPGRCVWPVVLPLSAGGRLQRCLAISRPGHASKGRLHLDERGSIP